MGSKASSCLGSFWIFREDGIMAQCPYQLSLFKLPLTTIKATSLKNAGILLAKKLVPGRYPFRRNSLMLSQTNELLDLSRPRNSSLNCPIKS
jgi:hypothetical protein